MTHEEKKKILREVISILCADPELSPDDVMFGLKFVAGLLRTSDDDGDGDGSGNAQELAKKAKSEIQKKKAEEEKDEEQTGDFVGGLDDLNAMPPLKDDPLKDDPFKK